MPARGVTRALFTVADLLLAMLATLAVDGCVVD